MIGINCRLRPLLETDLDIMNEWNHDQELNLYLGNGFHPVSKDVQKKWLTNMLDTSSFSTNKRYMIVSNNDEPIGLIGLYSINWIHRTSEIGMYIGNKNNRGKGYASEAFCLLENYSKEILNLRKFKLFVVEDNIRAVAFWKKMGFEQCGMFSKERYIKSEYKNLLIMEKLLDE